MLSHLAKFSVFVIVIMASFALSFYVLFGFDGNCGGEEDPYTFYGTFEKSLLTLFGAMLGDINFEPLLNDCDNDDRPPWYKAASVLLLVYYLVVMAVLLLNLLIAVLSTVHAEVYANARQEFHLARARVVQQTWRAVDTCQLPPPLNLAKPIIGIVVDTVADVFHGLLAM